jgi:hypothetical protein
LGKLKHKAGFDFGPLKLVGCEKCNEESVETGVKMKLSDGYELAGFVPGRNRVAAARNEESDAEAEARQQEADRKAAALAAEKAKVAAAQKAEADEPSDELVAARARRKRAAEALELEKLRRQQAELDEQAMLEKRKTLDSEERGRTHAQFLDDASDAESVRSSSSSGRNRRDRRGRGTSSSSRLRMDDDGY